MPRNGKLKHRSIRPDDHPVKQSRERVLSERVAPSRFFILLAFVLPVVCGLNLFASKPAAAAVLVSNFDQANSDTGDLRSTAHAQGFTTGTHSGGYNLESIEIVVWGSDNPSTFRSDVRNTRAELWSSVEDGDRAGHPKQKIIDLTADRLRTTSPLVFYAPVGTVLNPSTLYHLVIYSTVNVNELRVRNTSTNKIDSCEATGWSIKSSSHYLAGNSPESNQEWTGFSKQRKLRVNGTAIGRETVTVVPTVSLALAPSSISENGGVSTVTATLSQSLIADVTISVSASAVSPTTSGDFTLSTNRQLTITGGSTTSTGTVTITGVDNDADSPERTVTVSGVASCGGVSNPADETLTILDDETAPTVSLALTPSTISENGGKSTVTATLSAATSAEVTVTVSASAESPATNDDFTLSTGRTLTIAAGSTSSTGTVTITAVDNTVDAPNKTVTVSGVASGGAVSNPSNQTLTITDDETTPTVTLVLMPTSISENGGSSTVTATLSGASSAAVTVTVSASAVSPAVEGDFTISMNRTLTIAAGSTASTGTVTITAENNSVDTVNKTVTVSGAASGGGVSNPSSQTLTITDDDPPIVTLELTPTSISENGGWSTVTATLSTAAAAAVTVTVSASAVSPAVMGDFTISTNRTLSIAVGSTSSTGAVRITAVNNSVDAPNKSVTVSATASGDGVSNPSSKTLTITDDESTPTVTLMLSPSSISENGGSSTVTATLSGASSAAVTVTVSASAVSPAVAGDFMLSTDRTLTIAAGSTTSTGTVTITAVNNTVDAPDKTVTVSGIASGGGVSNPSSQTLAITDDDGTPTVTLVLSPSSISENGGSGTVTATLSTASTEAVTVTVSASAVSPALAGDFVLSANKELTIAAGSTTSTGTVTITAVNNHVHAPNKMVTVSATASGGGVSNPSSQTLTITEDDGTPTVTLVLSPSSISEKGESSTVTATLSGASSAAVTVTVSASAISPAVAGDFMLSMNKELTIAAGSTTSTGAVTITAVDNTLDALDKSVTVTGVASGGVSNTSSQTLTITDDESTPTVTLVLTPTSISENGESSTVTATLSGASSAVVTVRVSANAVSPAVAGDFILSTNKELTIAAGSATSTGTVRITAVDNTVDASNKSVTVSGAASGGRMSNPSDQTLTITDDDERGVVLTLDNVTVTEASGSDNTADYTVRLATQPSATVTVAVCPPVTLRQQP